MRRTLRIRLILGFLCIVIIIGLLGGGIFAEQNVVTLRLGHIFPITHPIQKAALAFGHFHVT